MEAPTPDELFSVDAYRRQFDAVITEVGRIQVLKTESKGRANKRVRLAVIDAG